MSFSWTTNAFTLEIKLDISWSSPMASLKKCCWRDFTLCSYMIDIFHHICCRNSVVYETHHSLLINCNHLEWWVPWLHCHATSKSSYLIIIFDHLKPFSNVYLFLFIQRWLSSETSISRNCYQWTSWCFYSPHSDLCEQLHHQWTCWYFCSLHSNICEQLHHLSLPSLTS